LNDAEADGLLEFLYTKPNDLNLTRVDNATTWDNHIALVEVLPPNKTDALEFLQSNAAPQRWARVVINQGATDKAGIVQYMVGPLPASEDTQILPLTYLYNSGRNFVRNPLPDFESIVGWFSDLGEEVSDMIKDLLGEVVNPGHIANAPPLLALARPAAWENDTISSWASINSPGVRFDAWSLMAQGLYCRFTISGRDSSKWKINEWYYNGIMYNSTESFRDAWKSGKVEKLPPNRDGSWTASEPLAKGLPDRDMNAPVMIQPEGSRYKIDVEENFISWMGFEFFFSWMQATAVSIWDVKFRGDRVAYEFGLQEAIAHYAGRDPMQVGMVWMDSLFGMGFNSYELVPGYDCPSYATYLNASFHQGESTITRKNALCVFEYTADSALQRHTTPTHLTISRNNYLVVRWVSTVGNYDYTFDYIFYLDGTIEVKVRASGYIFGAYNQLERTRTEHATELSKRGEVPEYEYGYQVHDLVASSMHDHEINFKADLDIAGSENTLYRVSVEQRDHKYSFEDFSRRTMHLKHTPVETETGLDWPTNAGEMFVVLNNESTNAWGEKRGYRIAPGTGMGAPTRLTMEDSTALAKSAKWAERNLWVLRQKDTERKSTSEYNSMEPKDPLIDFGKMVDGEDVRQKDL